MNISDRLKRIAGMVNRCSSIADIGTDHGYIPIFLVKNRVCERAVASDINRGPVLRALANVKKAGLEGAIECRLGGGLGIVSPGEVEGAVIAGMGGYLIVDILEERPEVVQKLQFVVLQPVQHSVVMRKYLYNRGYDIIDEELCYDEGKYYEIIKARFDGVSRDAEDIYYEIGSKLLEKKHPLLKEFIHFKIKKNEAAINAIKEDSESARLRKTVLIEWNAKLKEMLECL
ncbi:MAG: class I SAM-dependent methyltransferase [Bacillota bacterium]|nr:class I SAM-dependent methyltransferase [Bacillota bacterium]